MIIELGKHLLDGVYCSFVLESYIYGSGYRLAAYLDEDSCRYYDINHLASAYISGNYKVAPIWFELYNSDLFQKALLLI